MIACIPVRLDFQAATVSALAAVACYIDSLQGEFVFDDHRAIVVRIARSHNLCSLSQSSSLLV